MEDEGLLTAKQLAIELGTTPRVARKFLRAKFGEVGRGSRWAVRQDELVDLKRLYGYWRATDGRPRKESDAS